MNKIQSVAVNPFEDVVNPKYCFDFTILFYDSNNNKLEYTNILSLKTLSTSEIIQSKNIEQFLIYIEDDDKNLVCDALQKLFLENGMFIIINHISRKDRSIVRTYKLQCTLDQIVHNQYDYSGHPNKNKTKSLHDKWMKKILKFSCFKVEAY